MSGERAFYHFDRELGIARIRASYRRHRFPPHVHDSFLLGLTMAGVEAFNQEGRAYRSTAGCVRTINPGAVHDGGSEGDEPWAYQAIYVPAALFAGEAPPHFAEPVIRDAPLAAGVVRLFTILADEPDALAREEALARVLGSLAARSQIAPPQRPGLEHAAVRRARDHIAAHALGSLPLDAVAAAAGLSKFHLLRVFKAETGLTPWQYQTQVRVDAARAMLARGEPPGQVAAACGFVDQSHLTRRFRAVTGITPASYAARHRSIRTAPPRATIGRPA